MMGQFSLPLLPLCPSKTLPLPMAKKEKKEVPKKETLKERNIHDHYFKHTFGHPKVAGSFLKKSLSKELLAQIDLSTLQKRDKEFLPKKYRGSRYSDLLYSVKKKDGGDVFFLLHLEAQSKPDKLMGIRVLEYHTAITRAYLEDGATKAPPIISFVFYHSKKPWEGAKSVSEIFTDFDLYLKEGLQKSFLITLSPENMAELKKYGLASVPQIVLATQPSKDMVPILRDVMPLLNEGEKCCKDETINYMLTVDRREEDVFIEEICNFDKETANDYRTMFERAIKIAERKSLQIGRQEGIAQGGENMLKTLLSRGFITAEQIKGL